MLCIEMIMLPRGLMLYIAESVGERGEGRGNALYSLVQQ